MRGRTRPNLPHHLGIEAPVCIAWVTPDIRFAPDPVNLIYGCPEGEQAGPCPPMHLRCPIGPSPMSGPRPGDVSAPLCSYCPSTGAYGDLTTCVGHKARLSELSPALVHYIRRRPLAPSSHTAPHLRRAVSVSELNWVAT